MNQGHKNNVRNDDMFYEIKHEHETHIANDLQLAAVYTSF